MSSSGSSSGDSTTTQRYADYIETKHKAFLNDLADQVSAIENESPLSDYEELDVDSAFLGAGYALTSFSSVFSLFQSLMEDTDLSTEYTTALNNTANSAYVNNLIAAQGTLLSDDIETNQYPRLEVGARDINAVQSSTFIIAKANLEKNRLAQLNKFSTELQYKMISEAGGYWKAAMTWKQQELQLYTQVMQLYFAAKIDSEEQKYTIAMKDSLWPLTVLDFEKAGLGALQGAVTTSVSSEGISSATKAISGALSGVSAGLSLTGSNPVGGAVGGLVGLAASIL